MSITKDYVGLCVSVYDEINDKEISVGLISHISTYENRGWVKLTTGEIIQFTRIEDWECFINNGKGYVHPGEVTVSIIDSINNKMS